MTHLGQNGGFRPYSDYTVPLKVCPRGVGTTRGILEFNLILIKFIIGVYIANPGIFWGKYEF